MAVIEALWGTKPPTHDAAAVLRTEKGFLPLAWLMWKDWGRVWNWIVHCPG
jgi:hypothetical protein